MHRKINWQMVRQEYRRLQTPSLRQLRWLEKYPTASIVHMDEQQRLVQRFSNGAVKVIYDSLIHS